MDSKQEFNILIRILSNLSLISREGLFVEDPREWGPAGWYDRKRKKIYIPLWMEVYLHEEILNVVIRHELIHYFQFEYSILFKSSIKEDLIKVFPNIEEDLTQSEKDWVVRFSHCYAGASQEWEVPAFFLQKQERFWRFLKSFGPNWSKLVPSDERWLKYKKYSEVYYTSLFDIQIMEIISMMECVAPKYLLKIGGKTFELQNFHGSSVKEILRYVLT